MNDLALTPAASAVAAGEAIRAEVRTLTVTGPDIQSLLHAVRADIEIAPTMEIDSDDMAVELQEMLGRLSTVRSVIDTERKERGAPLRDALQWLMDGYSPSCDTIDGIINGGKTKLSAYSAAKREAQRKADESAAALRLAEAAKQAQAEADALAAATRAAAEAAALRAAGSEQVAAAMESQAMVAVDTARQTAAAAAAAVFAGPARMPVATKVKGISLTWKAECVDKAMLLRHIGERVAANDLSLLKLVEIDTRSINKLAQVQQDNLRVPGLRAYTESRAAVRKQPVSPQPAAVVE